MLLHEIKKSSGRVSAWKKFWRGNSNWKWNYCWKWLKWQKSRSWWSIPSWFEWGQTPLYRRLPKLKWFKRYFKLLTNLTVLNVSDLEESSFSSWDTVNLDSLIEHNLVQKKTTAVKLLWNGILWKALTIDSSIILSWSAKEKVEQAWWSFS